MVDLKLKRLTRWSGRGFWTMIDQGLFSTSNFVLIVLLARWLGSQDYGAFSVAYALFWFLGTLHIALFWDPMLIFGPGKHKHRLSEYLGILLYLHLGFAVLTTLPLLAAGVGFGLFGSKQLSLAMLGLALAGPFILFQFMMRRACYSYLKPQVAASGGMVYMILILAGTYVLHRTNWLSAATVFSLMGFASVAVGLWLALRIRVRWSIVNSGLTRDVFRDHWRYGRWAAPTEILIWVPVAVPYLLLPVWWGLEASAAMRALMNLVLPAQQSMIALSVLLLPVLVRAREDGNFERLVRLTLAIFTFGSVLYWVLLGSFGRPLVSWLYADQYVEYAELLWLVGLWPLLWVGVAHVFSVALRAIEQPYRVFWGHVLSTVVLLTVGVWFIYLWGVAGAVVGTLFASSVAAGTLAWLYVTSRRVPKNIQNTLGENTPS